MPVGALIPQWSTCSKYRDSVRTIVNSNGVYITDDSEHTVIDFYSQVMCKSLGHSDAFILEAMHKQCEKVSFLNTILFTHPIAEEYAQKLIATLPESVAHVYFTVSGAESTEVAIRVARHFTGRPKIMYRECSYHGASYGALSVSGDSRRKFLNDSVMPATVKIPHMRLMKQKCLNLSVSSYICKIEEILEHEGANTIAALLLETITGSGGMYMPDPGELKALRCLCDKHGILIIADEVMTGFGRTGTMWGFEQEGYVPDMVTMGKAITNGVSPLGAVAMSRHLGLFFENEVFPHGATNNTHLLSISAANAVLDAIQSSNIVLEIPTKECILRDRLEKWMTANLIETYRVRGLMGALELPFALAQDYGALFSSKFLERLYDNGLYTLGRERLVFIGPPLNITREELTCALDILERTILQHQQDHLMEPSSLAQPDVWNRMAPAQWNAVAGDLGYVYDAAVSLIKGRSQNAALACVVELGSGTGELLHRLSMAFGNSVGIECQSEFVDACLSKYPQTNVICGDMREVNQILPAELVRGYGETFVICVGNTLGNMSASDLVRTVCAMQAALPSIGEVILGFTSREFFEDTVDNVFKKHPDVFGEVRADTTTGQVRTASGYYSKFYFSHELRELLGDKWTIQQDGRNIYCIWGTALRGVQLYYNNDVILGFHSLVPHEMHVGLYDDSILTNAYLETQATQATQTTQATQNDDLGTGPFVRPGNSLGSLNDARCMVNTMIEAERRITLCVLERACECKGLNIADFGSGFGNTAYLACSNVDPNVFYCVDVSSQNMQRARSRNAQNKCVEYCLRDFCDTGIASNSLDVVVSQDAFLHAEACIELVYREIERALRPGGRLVFTDIMHKDGADARGTQDRHGVMLTEARHRAAAAKAGMCFIEFQDLSWNLTVHYKLYSALAAAHLESLPDNSDCAAAREYAQRLQSWLNNVDAITWGMFVFVKSTK